MYCKRCDKYLEENETVCPICGTKVKLKKILKMVYLTILIIIVGIVGTIALINNINKNKKIESLNSQKVDSVVLSKKDNIVFGQYSFKIPSDIQNYSKDANYVYVVTPDLMSSFKMNIVPASYESIKENSEKFVKGVIQSGTNIVSYYITTIGNREYFFLATIQNGKNYLYAVTELNSGIVVQTLVETTTDNGYETALLYVNKIIENYTKVNFDLNVNYESSLNDFLSSDATNNINLGDLFKTE